MSGQSNRVLAEEAHNSFLWAGVLAVPTISELVMLTRVHNISIQIILGITATVLFFAFVLAWSGFHYIFTPAGVEIRTLGFRLRFIPARDIREYRIATWSLAGGYGIRLRGNRSAYVWGNRVVRISTSDGEVFLGSNHPDRIIQALGQVKQYEA